MTRASEPKYAPGYDLFKLIVAAILTIILIALLLSNRQQQSVPLATPTATETMPAPLASPQGASSPQGAATATLTVIPATSIAQISPTAILSTNTPPPSTLPPTPTTTIPAQTPTAAQAPTPAQAENPNACPAAASRIKVGDTLNVLLPLNFRTGPGLNWPIILTNNPGTTMLVIGGPVCTFSNTPTGPRAYRWWNVRMQNGREGWSAEAPLISPYYFLKPIR